MELNAAATTEAIMNLKTKGEFETLMEKKDIKTFIKMLNLKYRIFVEMESKFKIVHHYTKALGED